MENAQHQDPRNKHESPPFNEAEQAVPGSEAQMQQKPDHGEASYKGFGRLAGKVALITGADSGIGRAVALAFAREGADVAIAYLSEHEDAKDTQALVEEAGQRALMLPGDLADEQYCQNLVQQTVDHLGHIDILVNNAAYQDKSVESIDELTAERLLRAFQVNIIAMFHLAKAAQKHMPSGSTIINTASIQAYQPTPSILDYATTKGAIVTFTKGLGQELIKKGIRVNCVAPGPVWTPLIAQSFPEQKIENFGKDSPMGRPAQPAEMAPLFVFLASEESSYVNGAILAGTGGKPLS
ncbi:MAG: SDR family oxidoreductase [Deltaproteobacteria bacterium]|nr:SDR family oxidoreductase [Deltaproteobacteria bacterium]